MFILLIIVVFLVVLNLVVLILILIVLIFLLLLLPNLKLHLPAVRSRPHHPQIPPQNNPRGNADQGADHSGPGLGLPPPRRHPRRHHATPKAREGPRPAEKFDPWPSCWRRLSSRIERVRRFIRRWEGGVDGAWGARS